MSKKSVYCMAATEAEAAVLYERLKSEGFSSNRITVLVQDESGGTYDFRPNKNKAAGPALLETKH